MSTTRPTVHELTRRLAAAGCVAADAEAAAMLAADPDDDRLESWLQRREAGEPLAWIVGATTFCGRVIVVEPGVYVPRWQSEQLARRAAAALPVGGRAVDLCTGAGAVAAHLMADVHGATVIGTDVDSRAVRCARRNGVAAIVADLGEPLRSASFDVVTVVAPYVPTGDVASLPADVRRHEPMVALHGGIDGLDLVRRAASTASRLLVRGGWLLAEVGGEQDRALGPVLESLGFERFARWHDDDGDLRGVAAVSSGG